MRYYIFAVIAVFMSVVATTTFFSCEEILLVKIPPPVSSNNNDSGGGLADIFAGDKKNTKNLTSPKIRVSQGEYGNKIVVAWHKIKNADYYRVLRRKKQKDSLSAPFTVVVSVVRTTFYEDNFNINAMSLDDVYASYQYKVEAITYDGLKNISLHSQDAYLLLPPRTLTGTKSLPTITVTWKAIRGAERYKIYRSDSKDSLGVLLPFVSGKLVRSFTDTTPDLEFAKKYYYYVVSVSSSGAISTFDAEYHPHALGIRIEADAPKPPKVSASKATSLSKIIVSWDEVPPHNSSNRVVYNVFKNSSISSRMIDIVTKIKDTQYVDSKSIQENVEYHYFVQAIEISSDGGELVGGYSADIDSSIEEDNPQTGYVLSSPNSKDIDARRVGRNIEITWIKAKKATGYKIYSATTANGTYKELDTLGDVDKYTHDGIVTDATPLVFYKIRSIRDDISPSLTTLLSNAQAMEPRPSIPEHVSASRNEYESDYSTLSDGEIYPIKITWDNAKGAHKYTLWRASSKDGDYAMILQDTAITTTEAYDKSAYMEIGKYYYYKVSAQNSLGASSDVSEASVGGFGALTNLALVNQVLRTIGSSHQKLTLMHKGGFSALGRETKHGDEGGTVVYHAETHGAGAKIVNTYTDYADETSPFVVINGSNTTTVNLFSNGKQTLDYTISGMYPARITGVLTIISAVASGGAFNAEQKSDVPHGTVQNSDVIQP